jgi:multicomponent Na+:H+ antiporter subunit E
MASPNHRQLRFSNVSQQTQPVDSDTRPGIARFLFTFAVSLLLWVLLAGTLDPQELIAGAVAALLVTVIAWPRLGIFTGMRLTPTAPVYLVRYLIRFIVALVAANFDVARRVLSPALPIRPAVVEVRTELKSSLGKMLLANSITLTPGTLTIRVLGDRLLVHWIDCPPGTDLEQATRVIATGFERTIKGFLK